MAREFREHNFPYSSGTFRNRLDRLTTTFEPHIALKQRVPRDRPDRTGDLIAYANMILVSVYYGLT